MSEQGCDSIKKEACEKLWSELQAGWDSVQTDSDWINEEDVYKILE